MFEEIELDSEDEQAVGENNYIEIDALPLEDANSPILVPEEEKKEPDRQSSKKAKQS